MKRWDVFDLLFAAARAQKLRFRLEKDWDTDTFYFDDPLQLRVNSRTSNVVLAILETRKLRLDVLLGGNAETLRLNVDTVRLEDL